MERSIRKRSGLVSKIIPNIPGGENKSDKEEETEKDDRESEEASDSNKRTNAPEREALHCGSAPGELLPGVFVVLLTQSSFRIPADFPGQLPAWQTNEPDEAELSLSRSLTSSSHFSVFASP